MRTLLTPMLVLTACESAAARRRVALHTWLLCSRALASNSALVDFRSLGPQPALQALHVCGAVPGAPGQDAVECQNKGNQTRATLHFGDAGPPLLTLDLPTGLRLRPVPTIKGCSQI